MRKNIKTRVICLVVAAMMLTGSLVFAAVNGSPYEILKDAIFNAMTYNNVTIEGRMALVVNGETYTTERLHMTISETGSIEYSFDQYGEPTGRFTYISENIRITSDIFTDFDGTKWYSAWVSSWAHTSSSNPFGLVSPQDRNSASFRFMELLLDLVVGDLKNNITMSTSGGVRSVTGTITHSQLPEIVRIGLDVIIEESQAWRGGNFGTREDYRSSMDVPIRSITFNRIHGDADIDANGNLLHVGVDVNMSIVNVFDEINILEFVLELDFTDIGTSKPESPIPGAVELLTPDFMQQRFGRRDGMTVHFTRNVDGSINVDSVTTTWPGDMGMRVLDEVYAPIGSDVWRNGDGNHMSFGYFQYNDGTVDPSTLAFRWFDGTDFRVLFGSDYYWGSVTDFDIEDFIDFAANWDFELRDFDLKHFIEYAAARSIDDEVEE